MRDRCVVGYEENKWCVWGSIVNRFIGYRGGWVYVINRKFCEGGVVFSIMCLVFRLLFGIE